MRYLFPSCIAFLLTGLAFADSVPEDLDITTFSGPDVTPSPACLCVSADGVVYAGVDLNGSLGKGPGRGRIIRLVDEDKDGIADSHQLFAEIDNARGLIWRGNQLFVLHTAFGDDGLSTGMDLVVLDDKDRDGVADGPAQMLVEGICSGTQINSRGTDHSTNGIQMGIDGWIYIAVGDFGFAGAKDHAGNELTLLGGGIVRVRPDGTEMELYTSGMRNIYDVAIDPFMNIFTRGNTNDGGGWNVRFTHHLQTGEYGYPRLFKNFASEIIPALEDLGGGSGVGALFLNEPTWPDTYNHQPLMADWGRKAVYLHRLTDDGPTFLQTPETFINLSQVTDLDVDASGQMFLSAWDGAGFKGDETKGYLVRVTPKGWKPAQAPNFAKASLDDLVALLKSESATIRQNAQWELLHRKDTAKALPALASLVQSADASLEVRVAALFTYAQAETDPAKVLEIAKDEAIKEFALRAAADRLPRLEKADLPLAPFEDALQKGSPRQKAVAAVALGRLGRIEAAPALLSVPFTKPEPEGKPKATQLDTLKNNRVASVKLEVRPGQTLYLNLSETNPVEEHSHLVLLEPVFTTADRKTIKLDTLKPISGTAYNNANPDGSEFKVKGKDKAPKFFVTLVADGTVAYKVPAQAVEFSAKARTATSNPKEGSIDFFASLLPPGESSPEAPVTPRHATPNPDIIVPHLAARALIHLEAVDACLEAIGTESEDLALWALSYLHEEAAVKGLLSKLETAEKPKTRQKLLTTLARLYQQEEPYDGTWWWTTRPDTRGPYYKPITWLGSPQIAATLEAETDTSDDEWKSFLADLNDSHRLGLEKLGTNMAPEDEVEQPTVDLAKIAAMEGAVGKTPIEDVILSLDKLKGDPKRGAELFTAQGCMACHALDNTGPVLGPFMGQIGSIMNKEQIATAILRPNDTISQGFQTAQITMKDGTVHMGFVTESNSDKVVLRNMTGQVATLNAKEIAKEDHMPMSMMPPGLANALSLEDFASLVSFLASKK